MITRAVKSGVAVERIAAALDMDVKEIKSRLNMLRGIHEEAVELLKDKQLSPAVFRILKRVTTVRQIEIAVGRREQFHQGVCGRLVHGDGQGSADRSAKAEGQIHLGGGSRKNGG